MVRQAAIATATAILWLYPALAAAQSDSEAKVAANALFDEGKRLLAGDDAEQACPKFEASLKLLDQLGVRLNLADCYEQLGKTAAAWTEFRESESRAAKRGDPRAAFARQRAEALTPKLVKLKVSVLPANQVSGLTVRRDGADIPAAAFGTPLPINPGSYTLEVSAPGFRSWSTRIDAKQPGELVTVEIPRLERAPPEAKVAKVAKTDGKTEFVDDSAQRKRRRLGLIVGAGGGVALGVGVGLGLKAMSTWDSVGARCDVNDVCDAEGTEINRKARLYGNIGTVVGGVGVAAMITGAVLYLTSPAARPVLEHAYLDADGASASFGFSGRF
jgi:hypothetical protein